MDKPHEMRKRLLSVEQTAEYLGLKPRTIYNQIGPRAKRPFPVRPIRIGKLVKFDISDLNGYIDGLRKQAESRPEVE
jgi:predicted DNA-binding transcriptional regulator AlpA